MIIRSSIGWMVLLAVLPFAALSAAWGEETRPRSSLQADPRLDQSITIERRRIYLGELLDRIASETGVRLRVDDQLGPASGYELSVFARRRKAREVLDAVADVYNSPPDRWFWLPAGKKVPREYLLTHTMHPDAVQAAREAEGRRGLSQQYELLQRLYAAPEGQRPAIVRRSPLLSGFDNPRSQAAFSMLQSLRPGQLQDVLAGAKVELPTSQLSSEAKAFADSYFRSSGSSEPPPERVGFFLETSFGPSVMFQLGGAGGGAALGGGSLERLMRQRDRGLWGPNLQGVPQRTIPPSPESGAPGRKSPAAALAQLSKAAPVDLVFDHAQPQSSITMQFSKPLTGDIRSVLEGFGAAGLICKYRHNFVLFRQEDWPVSRRSAAFPWPMREALRRVAAANRGFLGVEQWLSLSRMGRDQLDTLSDEFPDAARIKQMQIPLRVIADMDEAERAKVSTPQGADWDDWSAATRRRMLTLFASADVRRVRISLRPEKGEGPPMLSFYFGEVQGEMRSRVLTLQPQRTQKEE